MEHPSLKFILRFPNDEIQLASQHHLTNKMYITCQNCGSAIIYSKGKENVTCTKCHKGHDVPKEKSVLVACPKCGGHMQLINFAGLIIKKCSGCGYVPAV